MTKKQPNVTEQRDRNVTAAVTASRARAPYGGCHGVTSRDVTHRDVTVERDSYTAPLRSDGVTITQAAQQQDEGGRQSARQRFDADRRFDAWRART